MSEEQQANNICTPPESREAVPGPSREEEEMEADPGKASSPPFPLDGAVAPQEDSTSEPPSSLQTKMFQDWDHPEKVLEGLNRLRLSNTLCDVVLCCEGQDFSCHRAVLASVSSYFEDLFTSDTVESTKERLTISVLEGQTIGMMVNYVYTSEVSISTDNVQALLAASTLWNVTAVGKACCNFLEMHKRRLKLSGRVTGSSDPPPSLQTEMFEDRVHPKKVLEGLNRLRLSSSTLCDVVLCCEGQDFSCHRAVLASISSYFEAMFTSGMMETRQERVTISGLEAQTIGLLVNYVYTSKLSFSTDNVQALLAASSLWDVEAVGEDCFNYMSRRVDIENCVELYCVAESLHSKGLAKRSLDYILEHFTEVHQQEEFLSLSVEGLTEILSSDHLSVPKEDMVFDAAMLWLDNCPAARKLGFHKVLEHVRLPLISPSYLQHVAESLDVVREQHACQSFTSEANGERPFSNTARPRRTTVIVKMGGESDIWEDYKFMSFDPLTGGEWRSLGRLPSKTRGHAAVMSGSVLYVAGGLGYQEDNMYHGLAKRTGAPRRRDFLVSRKEMWRYDVQDYQWSAMADMNEARAYFTLVDLDGCVFAVGGTQWSPDSMERYDRTANTWTLMESVGVAAYSDCDSGPAVVALDGHLYFIGGGPSPRVARYNPETSVWTDVSPMQIPRDQPAVCTLKGKIYVTGGRRHNMMSDSEGRSAISEGRSAITENTVECFNPETNQWTMCAPMKEGRYWHSAVVVDGKIYVVGGQYDKIYVLGGQYDNDKNMERYCEETNAWETVDQKHKGLFNLNCVSLRLRKDHACMFDDDDDDDCVDWWSWRD